MDTLLKQLRFMQLSGANLETKEKANTDVRRSANYWKFNWNFINNTLHRLAVPTSKSTTDGRSIKLFVHLSKNLLKWYYMRLSDNWDVKKLGCCTNNSTICPTYQYSDKYMNMSDKRYVGQFPTFHKKHTQKLPVLQSCFIICLVWI